MKYLTIIILCLSVSSYGQDFEKEAKKILGPIKKSFMMELKTGLKKGPYDTIDVCHLKAPHLIEHDYPQYEIGRTSNKIRNKANAPKKWMLDILKKYENSTRDTAVSAKVYTVEDSKKVYVEPIYIKPVCLNCHGAERGSVARKIQKLYPKDQAMGYKLGEFRGLFYLKEK
tara:strand:- start:176 stop:688 length:513 start_codon:yes stop_codon:yes gene_type:complete